MVYVIKLDIGVLQSGKFRDDNPGYLDGSPCYYVGMTGIPPDRRFEQHRQGYKACRFAKEFGLELMPARFARCNPRTYDGALRHEKVAASRLKDQGCDVWQR